MSTKVFVMVDWFDPAYKAGGPIRSIVNLTKCLDDKFELFVFTSAYDLNDHQPMMNVQTNAWVSYGNNTKVLYATRQFMQYGIVKKIIQEINPEVIYLNGMFSKSFVVYPLWMRFRRTYKAKVIIAPRGMLKSTALAFKPFKKKIFLKLASILGLFKKVVFQATDSQEVLDIQKNIGPVSVVTLSNLPPANLPATQNLSKASGQLDLIFVGRIHPIKNLDVLLQSLKNIRGSVTLTVCGVIEDYIYYTECLALADTLPKNISVHFAGEKTHADLLNCMASHHALALPTKGENFGHAIFEMLSLGRPVLISDQTPWRNLEQFNVGFDVALNNLDAYSQALQQMVDWDQAAWDIRVKHAVAFSKKFSAADETIAGYLKLFTEFI